MEGSDWKETPMLGKSEVLENLDAQSRVLKGTVSPKGAAHSVSMTKPRYPAVPPHHDCAARI